MNSLSNMQLLQIILQQKLNLSGIFNGAVYYLMALGLIYNIYYRQNRFKYLLGLLSLFFIFSGSLYILKSEELFLAIDRYTEIETVLVIGFCFVIYTVIFWLDRDLPLESKLAEGNQQLEEIATRKTIEAKISQLDRELEQKVVERTSALISANRDLKENNILMDRVANLTPNLLYIYDLEQKCNVYHNHFVGEILGYSTAQIEQMNVQLFGKLVHPEDRDSIVQHHERCLNLKDDEYLEIEYRMQDNSGNWHWLQSKDTVFERDSTGQPKQILGVSQDITEAKRSQAHTAKLNLELAEKVETLEKWHEERLKLAKMNEFLQACLTIKEAKIVLTDLLQPLFPNSHGVVYLMNNSKNLLEAIATWGLAMCESNFEPDECWSLRRGNIHQVYPQTDRLYCNHINTACNSPTLCSPMIAKGKTLGMLYLRFDNTEKISPMLQELATTVSQNIALSFANLKLQEKLRHQSLRDPLTGLYNRRYLQECLNKEIDRARRKHHTISIIMLDVDRFKRFNDIYGHSAGDLVLKEVSAYLLSQTRQYDIACRYGGEELVIVMPDASIEDTIIRAEQIREEIKQLELKHQSQSLQTITVSIGISCFPQHGYDVDSLIRAADSALYEAKNSGRDCVRQC